jgi:hypothetical protein
MTVLYTIIIVVVEIIMCLFTNALVNKYLGNDTFSLTDDASIVSLSALLWPVLIPICILVIITKGAIKLFDKISDKLLYMRLDKLDKLRKQGKISK